MARTGTARTATCQSCGRTVDVDPGFSPWCERCGWNVQPLQPRDRPSVMGRLRVALGRRFGRALFEEMRGRRPGPPRPGLATVLAFALAGAVYAIMAAFAITGVRVLAAGFDLVGILLATLFLGLAWLMRPRFAVLEETPLDPAALLRLFTLLDRIGAAIGRVRVDAVVVTPEYNGGYGTFGWRRRRILLLGLPLWLALDPQERVALLGHELGHAVNRDATRGGFIAGALNALVELHAALEPDELLPSEEGLFGFLRLPFRLVLLAISRSALGTAYDLLLLLFRDTHRAEYYADAIAVRLAGRRATLAMLERLHAAAGVDRGTWVGETADPVGAIVAKVRGLPARERERIRRVERLEGTRLDSSHPPTLYRVEVIQAQPEGNPAVALTTGEADAIDAELERFREPIGRKVVDRYLAAIGS